MKVKLLAKNLTVSVCEGERIPFKLVFDPLSITETKKLIGYVQRAIEDEACFKLCYVSPELGRLRMHILYNRLLAALDEKHKQKEFHK